MSVSADLALPLPDAVAAQTSQYLQVLVEQKLKTQTLSFAEYMQLALYEPGLGYYMAGAHKFGEGGDFITAPEVSPLFGQCIARQCQQIFAATEPTVLELGAGSGKLAASIINAFSNTPDFKYSILEPSAELQQRQQRYLQGVLGDDNFSRVTWCNELPQAIDGVIIANEVMDALPFEQFTIAKDGPMQVGVALEDGALNYTMMEAPTAMRDKIDQIQQDIGFDLPHGYTSEISMLLPGWISALGACLKRGVLLLSDYGYSRKEYYLQERSTGTLSCFYQHRTHTDVFFYPGLQDITAHVDFTHVVESGAAVGLDLLGYTSQASFLLDNGLLDIAEPQLQACQSEAERLTLSAQIKTLSLPGEMGERFQFMALGKSFSTPLAGFRSQDLSHRL